MDLTFIRFLTITIIFIAFVPLYINQDIYGYIFSFLILGVALFVGRQYRCPHCKKVIDIRIWVNFSSHCMKCGEKLK